MANLSKEALLRMYYHMVLIRRFEEKSAELYQKGEIGGFLHLYIGHEATGVGAVHAMRAEDHVFTAYRDHGIALARGLEARACMAELLGRTTGVSGGRGGSMHFASREHNFWGGYGIVGGHLPLAAGVALRARYNNEDYAVLCLMGDGSTNIGYFHESLNISAVWDLPVVWLIENNQYGMGTAVERASGQTELRKRAIAYGMKEWKPVDGMNVMEVYDEVSAALKYARENGPVLMEVLTYRFQGHSMGDPERYRTADEIAKYREDDPIQKFRNYLTELKRPKITLEDLNQIEVQVRDEIAEAENFAVESELPALETLTEKIYVRDLEREVQ
ncbi:MAG: pyruvate dehydrogenase (acetyl-transferring) E1 component subunit alpha [Anaerolineae bacterium]|nr:pyruvate dehydrogenase (acetyl-transferring) E1 component subunit alpha [Anaerolineae bacterium]